MLSGQHIFKKNITLKLSIYFKLLLAIKDNNVFTIMPDPEDDWKANVPIRLSIKAIATIIGSSYISHKFQVLKEFYYTEAL